MPSDGPAANLRPKGGVVPPHNLDGVAWAVEAAVSHVPSRLLLQDSADTLPVESMKGDAQPGRHRHRDRAAAPATSRQTTYRA